MFLFLFGSSIAWRKPKGVDTSFPGEFTTYDRLEDPIILPLDFFPLVLNKLYKAPFLVHKNYVFAKSWCFFLHISCDCFDW